MKYLLKISENSLVITEAAFLVMLGMSSFPPRHEVYGKTTEKFIPT